MDQEVMIGCTVVLPWGSYVVVGPGTWKLHDGEVYRLDNKQGTKWYVQSKKTGALELMKLDFPESYVIHHPQKLWLAD